MKINKKRIELNQSRDILLLRYLWKWKVATTDILNEAFFKKPHSRYSYYRLTKMRRYGFVDIVYPFNSRSPYWTLGKKGFLAIKDELPALQEEGFKSENVQHDFLCSIIQQGPFIFNKLDGLGIVSEQQLRRYEPEFLPYMIRDNDIHRPDGYWLIQPEVDVYKVAFELEISPKLTSRLDDIADFYSNFDEESKVIWVIKGKGHLKRIKERMDKANCQPDLHYYFLLKDVLENGWLSKANLSHKPDQTIQNIITNKLVSKNNHLSFSCNMPKLLENAISLGKYSKKPHNKSNQKSLLSGGTL